MRGKERTKYIVNTLVVCLIIFTVVYLKYSSVFFKFISSSFRQEVIIQTVEGVRDSQYVLEALKKYHLHPPPVRSYNISHSIHYDPSQGQSEIVREIFANKRDGTFVECGAVDGVFLSNSLYLERALNWRGLLIEADTTNFDKLRTKNRNAFISNTCLSTTDKATVNLFDSINQTSDQVWWVKGIGKLDEVGDGDLLGDKMVTKTKVQCFPFYSFMLALDMKSLDYFSLDVEGAELNILKTIPFDKIEIKVLSVEWLHHTQKGSELNEFLESKGYHEYKSNTVKSLDYEKIFIKDGVELNHL